MVYIAHRRNERFGRLSFGQVSWAWSQLNYYKSLPSFLKWFTRTIKREDEEDEESIDRAFHFLQACEFKFPQSIMAVESMIKDLMPHAKVDYSVYVAELENWFRPAWMKQLDEIGVPIPLSERLEKYLQKPATAEEAIQQIKKISDYKKKMKLDIIDTYLLKTALSVV